MKTFKRISTILLLSIITFSILSCGRPLDVERRRAEELAALGRVNEAAKLYANVTKNAKDQKDYPVILLEAANVLLIAGDEKSALQYYGMVIKEAPLSEAAFIAHQKRAQIFLVNQNPDGAIEEYWSLIRHFEGHPLKDHFRVSLAEAELAAHQFDNAKATVTPLLESKDKNILERAMFVEAESLFMSRKWNSSIAAYRDFLKEFPNSKAASEAVCHMAVSYEGKGELGSAKAILYKWQKKYGNDPIIQRCERAIFGIVDNMKDKKESKK